MSKLPKELEQLISKKKSKKKARSFYLDEEIYKSFVAICEKQDRVPSSVVESLLQYYVMNSSTN